MSSYTHESFQLDRNIEILFCLIKFYSNFASFAFSKENMALIYSSLSSPEETALSTLVTYEVKKRHVGKSLTELVSYSSE